MMIDLHNVSHLDLLSCACSTLLGGCCRKPPPPPMSEPPLPGPLKSCWTPPPTAPPPIMGGLLPAEELDPTRAAAPTAPFPLPLEDTESVLLRWWLGGTVWASERWIWGETSKILE